MTTKKVDGAPQAMYRTPNSAPISRAAPKSAFETALARKSAQMSQPVATTPGAVGPNGMTKEQSLAIEQALGQQAARTILAMPQPKNLDRGDDEGGLSSDE